MSTWFMNDLLIDNTYNRRVSEIKFTCSYDRYRPIYDGGAATVYGSISIIGTGEFYLENAPNISQ